MCGNNLKDGIIVAHQAIKDGMLDDAETAFNQSTIQTTSVFDPGIHLSDTAQSRFLTDPVMSYPIGIPPLDKLGLGPAPGELTVILAPPNRGKTQFCVHIAKV